MKPKQTAGLVYTQSFLRLPPLEKIKLSLEEVAGYGNEGR